jgi:hypothetical protein
LAEKAAERTLTSGQRSRTPIGRVVLAVATLSVLGALIVTAVGDVAGSPDQPLSARVRQEVSSLLGAIPQNGVTLGRLSAPVTLQIFGDLESPDVRTFVLWLLPDIIREWVRTNKVKLQYRAFMTTSSPYPNVFVSQQTAALAAGAQDKLWNFIETFYHEQGQEHTPYVTRAYLEGIAKQIPGLALAKWEREREIRGLSRQVVEDDRAAQAIGFPDAPVFLIGRTGGKLTPWLGFRLYEEPGLTPGLIKRPVHPLSFITSKMLKVAIEHLRGPVEHHSAPR